MSVAATKSALPTRRAAWLAEREFLAKTSEVSADKFWARSDIGAMTTLPSRMKRRPNVTQSIVAVADA